MARGARCALLALLALISPQNKGAFVPQVQLRQLAPRCAPGAAWGRLGPPSPAFWRARAGDGDVSTLEREQRLPRATKGFGKPCARQQPRPARFGDGATTPQDAAAEGASDSEDIPLLRNQIRRMTRLNQRLQRAEPVTETVHPAEKASAATASGGFSPKTSTLKRRAASVEDRSRAQTQKARIEWFRAKTEELAMLRDNGSVPFQPGQLVYCANDNGRLVRGTLLSLGRAKNRLMVGRVRLHPDADTGEGPGPKVKDFRLPALFPVGGCNGGLESGLETFVSFDADKDLRGAAGMSALTSARGEDEDGDRGAGNGEKVSTLSWLTKQHAPAVDDILIYLEEQRLRVMQMPFRQHNLDFDAHQLGMARQGLKHALIDAETRLLRFCEVLAYALFQDTFTRSTGVNCEIRLKGGVREHFTVEEPLDDDTLLMLMSGEGFGKRGVCDHLVSNMRVLPMSSFQHAHNARKQRQKCEEGQLDYLGSLGKKEDLELSAHFEGWCAAKELTHYLVYEANSPEQVDASGGVLRFFGSRKSATELADIVADKLCHVDAYVGSSSSRGHFDARQIHNALQLRVVVESAEQATQLLQRLQSIKFSQRSLLQADVPVIRWGEIAPGHATDRLHVVDFQNRLAGEPVLEKPGSHTLMRAEEAKVGWRGLVVMVKWWGAPIMIVMEPLEVFHMQQELSTSVSYWQYKERQRKARKAVERRWPVYELTRALTHWALTDKDGLGPSHTPKMSESLLSRIKIKVSGLSESEDTQPEGADEGRASPEMRGQCIGV